MRILIITGLILMVYIATVQARPTLSPDTSTANVSLPLRQLRPTSGFGWRVHPITGKFQFHKGIDLAAHQDTVYSILDGIIGSIGFNSFIGNYIQINHTSAAQSLYGHLSAITVLPGERVTAGQPIGITGATGRVTGEHLHFSIKYQGRELSPLAFLIGLFAKPP